MPVDSALLAEASIGFDKRFQDSLKQPLPQGEDLLGMLAYKANVTTKKTRFPILGAAPRWREWLGERVYNDMARYAMEIEVKTYECSLEVDIDDIDDDQLGAYGDEFALLGEEARWWPRDLLVAALKAGGATNGWDGQFFFDTDHPVDPYIAGAGTWSNLFTGTALTDANLAAVITAMSRIKGPGGRHLRIRGRKLLIPPQLEFTAKAILAPQLVGNGASNIYQGLVEPVVVPELEDAATTWYVAADAGMVKPFIFAERQAPRIEKPSDDSKFERNKARFGGKARGAAVYGMPYLIAKAVA